MLFSCGMLRVDMDIEDGGMLRLSGKSLTCVALAMPFELMLEGPDFSTLLKFAISLSFLVLIFLLCCVPCFFIYSFYNILLLLPIFELNVSYFRLIDALEYGWSP